ncbi:hypothetical protein EV702DRAFT_1130099 [Suillus placidus]|uniref:Uncharacterized protein n=1 Tax=Suillus placidus TaxID=48579 RepID=A0A9P6ZN69_9AGAM|nr:hypothetical protein EV702DRAFT_1130099 [Suillus placidus]
MPQLLSAFPVVLHTPSLPPAPRKKCSPYRILNAFVSALMQRSTMVPASNGCARDSGQTNSRHVTSHLLQEPNWAFTASISGILSHEEVACKTMVMPKQTWLDMINPSVFATLRQRAILIVNVHDHGCESGRFPFLFLFQGLSWDRLPTTLRGHDARFWPKP